MPITFTSQDYIAYQVKQVLRENQATYEDNIYHNFIKKIEEQYMPSFDKQIADVRNNISTKDTINILLSLKNAYQNAGRINDSQILEQQIQKLNIEG